MSGILTEEMVEKGASAVADIWGDGVRLEHLVQHRADELRNYARAALEAVLPLIGEALAKEIDKRANGGLGPGEHEDGRFAGFEEAAKIVRTLTGSGGEAVAK